jgi:hypothetical protein
MMAQCYTEDGLCCILDALLLHRTWDLPCEYNLCRHFLAMTPSLLLIDESHVCYKNARIELLLNGPSLENKR